MGTIRTAAISRERSSCVLPPHDALDPTDKVPHGLLEDALVYFDVNKPLIPQTHDVAIADFSRSSGKDRFWLVDLTTGTVEADKVAHGDGSDPDNDGSPNGMADTNARARAPRELPRRLRGPGRLAR